MNGSIGKPADKEEIGALTSSEVNKKRRRQQQQQQKKQQPYEQYVQNESTATRSSLQNQRTINRNGTPQTVDKSENRSHAPSKRSNHSITSRKSRTVRTLSTFSQSFFPSRSLVFLFLSLLSDKCRSRQDEK